jgi:4-aminobutyrate aminotransferase-like enzyme
VKHIEDTLLKTIAPAEETAAIVVEPVQGEGGYVVPPQKFFDELARVAHANGILLIFDEVQSGMGRTGKMWAADHFGMVPDILTVAKGIASGMPLGATVARADLMTWPPGAHASTFGGNPVACAAALEAMAVIERMVVSGDAARLGDRLRARLDALASRVPLIGEVRGAGAMQAVELVRDRRTKEPADTETADLVRAARRRGLLLFPAGTYGNVIRFLMPLTTSAACLDEGLDVFEASLSEVTAAPRSD